MEVIVIIAQLLLGLSILVGVHEAGHFFTARWFKMRVEQFALGLPPQMFGLNFLPSKLFSIKRGETEYLLSPVPLGGYVKIAGMMDESSDTDQLASEPQPWEFRSKPAWQRLIVMLGGVVVNVITGIVIFGMLMFIYGDEYLPAKEAKYGIVASETAQKVLGLQTGDKILKVNGKAIENFADVASSNTLLNSGSYYTIDRNGKQMDVAIPDKLLDVLSDKKNPQPFITPRLPFSVGAVAKPEKPGFLAGLIMKIKGEEPVVKQSAAQKIGLQPDDKIVNINGTPIRFFDELQTILKANKSKKEDLTISRNGTEKQVSPQRDSSGAWGFHPKSE